MEAQEVKVRQHGINFSTYKAEAMFGPPREVLEHFAYDLNTIERFSKSEKQILYFGIILTVLLPPIGVILLIVYYCKLKRKQKYIHLRINEIADRHAPKLLKYFLINSTPLGSYELKGNNAEITLKNVMVPVTIPNMRPFMIHVKDVPRLEEYFQNQSSQIEGLMPMIPQLPFISAPPQFALRDEAYGQERAGIQQVRQPSPIDSPNLRQHSNSINAVQSSSLSNNPSPLHHTNSKISQQSKGFMGLSTHQIIQIPDPPRSNVGSVASDWVILKQNSSKSGQGTVSISIPSSSSSQRVSQNVSNASFPFMRVPSKISIPPPEQSVNNSNQPRLW